VALLGAEHRGLLLGPPDEQHPLGFVELGGAVSYLKRTK
jgi:hypothetical protein